MQRMLYQLPTDAAVCVFSESVMKCAVSAH